MQLELVGFDVLAALGVVAVKPNVDHFARIVDILDELDFTLGLGRAEEAQTHIAPYLQLVVLRGDLSRLLVHVHATAPPEQRHVPVLAWQRGVIYIEVGVARSELCTNCVLDGKSIFFGLKKARLGEPGRCEDLKWVRVLTWLQRLSLRKVDAYLSH